MWSRIASAPAAPDGGVAGLHRRGREDVSREAAHRRVRSRGWSQTSGVLYLQGRENGLEEYENQSQEKYPAEAAAADGRADAHFR